MDNAKELALVNATGAMDPAAFAFCALALQIQLERDFMPAWRGLLPQPDQEMVVVGYTSTANLPATSFFPVEILASLDDPGVLGDHSGIAEADIAFGRSLPQTSVISHEVLEMRGDRYGNRWIRLPSGIVVAFENCDPVENDTYLIDATIAGQTRSVEVQNFVYPAWFGEGDGDKFDHLGLCRSAGENRGYVIMANDDGTTTNVFASTMTEWRKDQITARQAAKRKADARSARRFAANAQRHLHKIPPF